MSRSPFKVASRATAFLNSHPEWADMAYRTLFERDGGARDVQYDVAQALMAAFEMGRLGGYPARPKHLDARLSEEPAPDPEVDAIYEEIRNLAWSPLTGQPRPDGYVKWAMNRHFEQETRRSVGRAKLITRTKPAAPAAPVKVMRRTRA